MAPTVVGEEQQSASANANWGFGGRWLTGMYGLPLRSLLLEQIEQLPRHQRAGIGLLHRSSLADDIFGRVWPLDTLISRRGPPVFYLLYLRVEERIFRLAGFGGFGEELVCVCGEGGRHGRIYRRES